MPVEIDAGETFVREPPQGPRWAFEVRDRDWFHGDAIRDTAPQLARLSGYANNQYAGHSPGTIRRVYSALGVPHERPARIEQTSLFE